MKFTFLGHIT